MARRGGRHKRVRGAAVAAAVRGAYLGTMADTIDIALTPSAAKRVAWIAERQGKKPILRLAVDGGGCAGFQYKFGLAEDVEAGDLAVEQDGVSLVVDEMSLDLVRGGAVDFVESLGGAAFQVRNPNAASGCGCGSSFSI
jgi:iron-sulfur cluster assembly accessory protein